MKEKTGRPTMNRTEGPGYAVFSNECWFLTPAARLRTQRPAAMKRKREGGRECGDSEGGGRRVRLKCQSRRESIWKEKVTECLCE